MDDVEYTTKFAKGSIVYYLNQPRRLRVVGFCGVCVLVEPEAKLPNEHSGPAECNADDLSLAEEKT